MQHYTYAHYRNDTGQVFYIGKGVGSRAWDKTARSSWWTRICEKHGRKVQVLARWGTAEEALDHEMFLIKVFRELGHPLCNFTNGGEGMVGYKPSAATREKQAAAKRGRKLSLEHRQKISASNKGRQFSDETRKKISESQKGRQLKRGYKRPAEVVALAALNKSKFWEEDGLRLSQKAWAEHLGVAKQTVSARLKRGLTPSGKARLT